jgi:hypothetical protein
LITKNIETLPLAFLFLFALHSKEEKNAKKKISFLFWQKTKEKKLAA